MKTPLSVAMLLAIMPFAASARDSLGGVTYVEAGVQRLSIDDGTSGRDAFDFDNVGTRTSIELPHNFYVYGGYACARDDDLAVDIDARDMQSGLGYRHTVFDNTELIAEPGFQHTERDSDLFHDNLDGGCLRVDLRGALSSNFEAR